MFLLLYVHKANQITCFCFNVAYAASFVKYKHSKNSY